MSKEQDNEMVYKGMNITKRRWYGRGVEGIVANEKWKKKRLGSRIRSTKDQCLEERR